MKSLADWLEFLEKLHPKGLAGIELGLSRAARVKAELGQRPACPVVTVGGTNGKGSTCAYLEAIYRAAGYRVGTYTSPHLLAYGERTRIDGAPADEAALCAAFARVEAARRRADVALTYFEFGTLAAWELFAEARPEVLILEVGLGGRLDAVNIYDADVAVVTGIALDHTDWLGPDRESIGFEKAGIYRAGRMAVCADADPPQSLVKHAREIGADLRRIGRDFRFERTPSGWTYLDREGTRCENLPLPALGAIQTGALDERSGEDSPAPVLLAGARQLGNAAAALAAIGGLRERLPLEPSAIRDGLRRVRLAGRFQRVAERPAVLLDVAHNPQAAECLAENLDAMNAAGRFRRTLAVVGMLSDKDIAGALRALAGRIDVWLLASLPGPRGASAQTLAAALGQEAAERFASPAEAYRRALGRAEEDDRIVAFGSFLTVAAILREIGPAP